MKIRFPYRSATFEGHYEDLFEGVVPNLERRYRETKSETVRTQLEEYMSTLPCTACAGSRLAPTSLAVTGGVHAALDAVKAVMTGAHAVQLVSVLLQRGPGYLKEILEQTGTWLEEHEYESLEQMRGSMNLASCPDAGVYERANYMLMLQSWRTSH